ncbi:hypothetical protein PoB_002789300 [Plakobranchus ocellatus]|uniref:Uncharacterized protein n=1 Tax=Plakobranchus ocellatus TaxID=259542 RepID=A0AAV4A2K5_9GAST|nr:hypothetical protein PoB_002789300 [Plakobranchus ocellatus]
MLVLVFAVLAFASESSALTRSEWMAKKSALANSEDFIKQARKRSEETEAPLICYSCRSSDNSTSCDAGLETCATGELCASVWHEDNTNFDGCMASTICKLLQDSGASYARCCATELCNMLLY